MNRYSSKDRKKAGIGCLVFVILGIVWLGYSIFSTPSPKYKIISIETNEQNVFIDVDIISHAYFSPVNDIQFSKAIEEIITKIQVKEIKPTETAKFIDIHFKYYYYKDYGKNDKFRDYGVVRIPADNILNNKIGGGDAPYLELISKVGFGTDPEPGASHKAFCAIETYKNSNPHFCDLVAIKALEYK